MYTLHWKCTVNMLMFSCDMQPTVYVHMALEVYRKHINVYGLFNDAVNSSGSVGSNGRME